MRVLIETSVLVSGSICGEYEIRKKIRLLKHRFYERANNLFESFKARNRQSNIIITKTVENEARNVLNKAVNDTLREAKYTKTLMRKHQLMVVQHIILNDSLDNLDYYVEECSIRLPIDTEERDRIKNEEIEPFLRELVKGTVRYIAPVRVPRVVRGRAFRKELQKIMEDSLPTRGVIYKGMPGERDFTIMAEATLLKRQVFSEESLYVATLDNHFKPNPVQIGSFYSPEVRYTGKLDSTVRDALEDKFGFIGEVPEKIAELLE